MIEYKIKENKKLSFDMVENNQFFYNKYNCLCQKIDYNKYIQITYEDGTPKCDIFYCSKILLIRAICKKVKKITMEIEE